MIENVEKAKEEIKEYYTDAEKWKEAVLSDDFQDVISEIADNNGDLYTTNLMKWNAENYDLTEEAITEFGFPKDSQGNPDMPKAIMQGQYLENERLLMIAWEELKEEVEEEHTG